MVYFLNNLTGTNTPQPITGANIRFVNATFFGYKNFNTGISNNNSGPIILGKTPAALPFQVNTGANFNLNLGGTRSVEDLTNFWFQGTSGDGVYVIAY